MFSPSSLVETRPIVKPQIVVTPQFDLAAANDQLTGEPGESAFNCDPAGLHLDERAECRGIVDGPEVTNCRPVSAEELERANRLLWPRYEDELID